MADLEERFRSLRRTPVPDLWEEAVTREPRRPQLPNHPRRALAALTALIVAGAGFAVVVVSFRGAERLGAEPEPTPILGPRGNGPIWFRVGGGDGPSFVYEVRPDGTGERPIFGSESDPLRVSQVAWSPDGGRIAYVDPVVGDRGVYVSDPGGRDPVRLTDGANDGWPTWSPDGTKIAFSSTRSDPSEGICTSRGDPDLLCPTDIYVMEADGSKVLRLTSDPAPEYRPVWSPDGLRIAFVKTFNGSATAVYVMNADGSEARQISSHDGGSDFSPSWSPDGSQLVFASIRYEDLGIFVVNADGTDEHPLVFKGAYVNDPVWSPDGELIAFVGLGFDDSPDSHALYVMRPDGSAITRLTSEVLDPYGVSGDIAWQPVPLQSETVVPSPSPAEPTAVDVHVSTTTGIAPFPSGVAAGEGGVWVGAARNDGSGAGDVVRLDPATGEIVARIPVRSLPGWEFGAAGITVGLGSVWVVGGTPEGDACCSALVSRIDPSTNALIDEIAIPDVLFGADVWVDQTGLYVLSFIENEPALDLASLDPETHEVRWRVSLPAQWSQTVFVSGGSVWVLGTAPDARGPVEVNTLYQLDLVDGRVLAEIALRNTMYAPAVAPDVLWLRTIDGAQRFDPLTAQPIGDPVRPAPGCCTGAFVADGAGGVWVISSPGLETERGVWHIDVSGRIVEVGEVADREQFQQMLGQGYAFDPVTRTIWVQHYEDSVSRVELVPAGGS